MTRTDELRAEHTPRGARELLVASIGSDPYERIHELRELAKRRAEAEGVAYQLQHERKHLLAKLATEYATAHAKENMSEAKLDRLARADERYRRHIEGTAAALQLKEELSMEYWAIRSELTWDEKAIAHLNAMSKLEEPS